MLLRHSFFKWHVSELLKLCSQRTYILRMLHSRGLGANQLNACLNHALIVSLISYALPAWGGFISAGQRGRINAFLKRADKCGFCFNLISEKQLLCSSAVTLCNRMQNQSHCLLPSVNVTCSGAVALQTLFCHSVNITYVKFCLLIDATLMTYCLKPRFNHVSCWCVNCLVLTLWFWICCVSC